MKGFNMSFKPYYKWITFNTKADTLGDLMDEMSFKPYYKWITFNTLQILYITIEQIIVLNLIING